MTIRIWGLVFVVFVLCLVGACSVDRCGIVPTDDSPIAEPCAVVPVLRYNPRNATIDTGNLLPNGSFELGADHWSSLGRITGSVGDLSGLYGMIKIGGAFEGRRCLRVDMGPGMTPVTYADCWPPARVVQHAPLAASIGWSRVTQGQAYTLSAAMRSTVPGTLATLMFRYAGVPHTKHDILTRSKTVVLTDQWQRYRFTAEALTDDLCIAVGPDMSDRPEVAASVWIDAVQVSPGDDAGPFAYRQAVEIGMETRRYGNIFHQGDPVKFIIGGTNRTGRDVTIPIAVTIENYFGKVRSAPTVMLEIPSGDENFIVYSPAITQKGYYRLTLTWQAGGIEQSRVVKLAVIAPYKYADSCFGVNHGPSTAGQLALLRQAGVTWVRNWALNWNHAEPNEGQLSYDTLDAHVDRLIDSDMHVLSLLPSNPSTNWSSTAGPDVKAHRWERLAYAPREPQKLYDFITATVLRYKDRHRVWEFLNEPLWVPDFCLPKSKGYTVDDYITLLKGAAAAMKSADPCCVVVGGLSIQAEMTLGDQFITAGGLDDVDIYNLHPYPGLKEPEFLIPHLQRILACMDAQGARKPIWATEWAYYGTDDKPWSPWVIPKNHWSAMWQLDGERQCADYCCRFSLISLAHGVDKLFWHQPLEGVVNNGSWNLANCMLAEDAVPKRFYPVQSALANMLGPDPACAGAMKFPAAVFGSDVERLYGYGFQCGPRAVLAVWTDDGMVDASGLTLARGLEVFDLLGNPLDACPAFTVSPVYLVSTSQRAEELLGHWFQ